MDSIYLDIHGQCCSGKNSVIVTHTGKRFPNARFKKWREVNSTLLLEQLKLNYPDFKMITVPISVSLEYTPGDLRRRDVPGMVDAIWHLLEYTKIIKDDALLGKSYPQTVRWLPKPIDRENPGVGIRLYWEK